MAVGVAAAEEVGVHRGAGEALETAVVVGAVVVVPEEEVLGVVEEVQAEEVIRILRNLVVAFGDEGHSYLEGRSWKGNIPKLNSLFTHIFILEDSRLYAARYCKAICMNERILRIPAQQT